MDTDINFLQTKLILFDYDGTLVKAFTHDLLPNVREWFADNRELAKFAIVSNQGGVGLRLWMETDEWGEPERYPTEEDCYARMNAVLMQLGLSVRNGDVRIYSCFAYQARNGDWSPRPAGKEQAMEWQAENRKPSAGLLLQAIKDAGVTPAQTLMVGDDWNNEDSLASKSAGCRFVDARSFFGGHSDVNE